MQAQIRDETDQSKKIGVLPVLIFILMVLFLPSVFIVVGLFAITYFSSYNRRWWLGLAVWALALLYFYIAGIPVGDMYKLYITEFVTTIWDNIGSETGVANSVWCFWRTNFCFVVINGFLIEGIIGAIFYFVGFDGFVIFDSRRYVHGKNHWAGGGRHGGKLRVKKAEVRRVCRA